MRLLWLPLLILWSGVALAQQPAPPPAAASEGLTAAQAQQALEVLQDPAKRDQLIATLQTIARAAQAGPPPVAAPPAAPPSPATPPAAAPSSASGVLAPHSLASRLIVDAADRLEAMSQQMTAVVRVVTDFPEIRAWIVRLATSPAARDMLLAVLWRLAVVAACARAAEWAAARLFRRPLAALADRAGRGAAASPETSRAGASQAQALLAQAWRTAQLLPLAIARLLLELAPVAAFAAVGNALLGTPLGDSAVGRVVILALVNAYVLCRGILCLTRAVISPTLPQLRLLRLADDTARYIEIWVRRGALLVVFGFAMAEIVPLFGLPVEARDAMIKLVALVAHLFLVVIVLQCRRAVARRIGKADSGGLALLRNRLADIWHIVAIFFILALWVVWAIDVQNGLAVLVRFFLLTVLVLMVARAATVIALALIDRLFRPAPGRPVLIGGRAGRYYPLLRRTVSAIVTVIAAVALLEVWGLDAFQWFRHGSMGGQLVSATATIGLTALVALAIWEGTNIVLERRLAQLAEGTEPLRSARLRTLLPMLRTALLIAVLAVVALTALSEIGVNVGPLLAGAGIVGIAVGFGSQKLVQDLITGIFLLLENAMQVGDAVTVAGLAGQVEELSIRSLRLRAGDGSVHIIPFSSVTSVTNSSRGVGNAVVSVNLSFHEDTDRASAILAEIATDMRADPLYAAQMKGNLELWGVDKVDGAMATIVGQIVCTDAGRWAVQREFNRRMKRRFQELGLAIADPSRTVVLQPLPVRPQPSAGQNSPPAGG